MNFLYLRVWKNRRALPWNCVISKSRDASEFRASDVPVVTQTVSEYNVAEFEDKKTKKMKT